MKKVILIITICCFMLVGCTSTKEKDIASNNEETIEGVENEDNSTEDDEVSENIEVPEVPVVEEKQEVVEAPIENNSDVKAHESNGITIVIDSGHSSNPKSGTEENAPGSGIMKAKDVSGATGLTGLREYKLNQDISNLLKADLEKRGFNVIMTKTDVSQSISNIERAEVGNNAGANLVIRIHADSFSDSSAMGASMLVPPKDSQYTSGIADLSYSYGNTILNSYISKVPIKNRGVVVRKDMTGFNWSKVPVVILEMGFLSNPSDNEFLSNESNYSAIIEGIGQGVEKCF